MEVIDAGRRIRLTQDYSISRLIVGGWQFSGGHGAGASEMSQRMELLASLVDRGLTTFDCADIYTGVEELFGELIRTRQNTSGDAGIQVHTKFVPDLDILPSINKSYVERITDRSLSRLGVERLDLVQFHWWDFGVPGYVETAHWLSELQAEGKIRHLGVTNFDRNHLAQIVDSGIGILSNQVQYSVLDRRPQKGLEAYCREKGIALLCYGGLSGGFLTEAYMGMTEPPLELANRSLIKYRLMIDEMGGWGAYQSILGALDAVAVRHGVSLPAVALRFVLDRPAVAATITGLDSLAQAEETVKVLDLRLETEDLEEIGVVLARAHIPPGTVYGLERDREGPHGMIMRYNLNEDCAQDET